MAWWVWLVIIAVVAIAVLIIGYIWGRKNSPAPVDRVALAESERKALQEQIEAEKIARHKVTEARNDLARQLKANLAWYNTHRKAIEDAAQKEFADLVSDPDALDRKLSDLLGSD